ncbi:MAG: hypothetical protein OEW84_07410, partial [Aigarchaeota archaeon]|nr:hypothetical protein [Aigarchaeota archaeon]
IDRGSRPLRPSGDAYLSVNRSTRRWWNATDSDRRDRRETSSCSIDTIGFRTRQRYTGEAYVGVGSEREE